MVSERANHDNFNVLRKQRENKIERGGVLELQGESENHICCHKYEGVRILGG